MTILIENLKIEAIIGVLPFEREKPQKIIIDAELNYSYDGEYLDYVEIVEFITQTLQKEKYEILEVALQDLKQKLKIKFSTLTHLTLSIKKPDILSDCVVGVKIT